MRLRLRKSTNGRLNPKKVGVDNAGVPEELELINKWNKEGLINSKINGDTATQLFTSGKAAYWVTGPWNIDTARKAGINFKIVQVPKIKCNAVPFLGVQGLMVTKYASGHGVADRGEGLRRQLHGRRRPAGSARSGQQPLSRRTPPPASGSTTRR